MTDIDDRKIYRRLFGFPTLSLLMTLLTALSVQAAEAPLQESQSLLQLREQVRSDTEALNRRSPSGIAMDELREVAERRKRSLLALAEVSPEAAIQEAIDASAREQLPAEVRVYIEQPAIRQGTLEVLGVLAEDGRPGLEYHLVTKDENLRLATILPEEYWSGTRLTVRGLLLGDWLVAAAGDVSTDFAVTAPETNTNVLTRTALLISVNFSDLASEPWTMDLARERYNNITDWYLETSYGQMTIVSDIAGWFTIAAPSTSCATTTFRVQAEAAARAAGFEPNNYNHVVIAFPRVTSCHWAGLAQVPGRYVWLNNTISRSASVHELGHNLGLSHSHSQRCSDDPLRGTCTAMEYGDIFDAMGSSTAEYHGSFRRFLGWIPSSDVLSVSAADGDVTAVLRSPETTYGTRVLQVRRAVGDYFFIEAREAIGYDSVLTQYPAVLNGITVYVGPSFRTQSLVDIGYTTATRADAPLQYGETLLDIDGDLSISPLYNLDGDIYVQVHFGLAAR